MRAAHQTVTITMQALHAKANPTADELVIPNTYGLPYIRLDDGPMKGGSAGVWNRLREVSGVEACLCGACAISSPWPASPEGFRSQP